MTVHNWYVTSSLWNSSVVRKVIDIYTENRKKAKAYTEAQPTFHHDLFLEFLLKMSLNFVLRAANW